MKRYQQKFALCLLLFSVLLALYQLEPIVGVAMLPVLAVCGLLSVHRRGLKRAFDVQNHVERYS